MTLKHTLLLSMAVAFATPGCQTDASDPLVPPEEEEDGPVLLFEERFEGGGFPPDSDWRTVTFSARGDSTSIGPDSGSLRWLRRSAEGVHGYAHAITNLHIGVFDDTEVCFDVAVLDSARPTGSDTDWAVLVRLHGADSIGGRTGLWIGFDGNDGPRRARIERARATYELVGHPGTPEREWIRDRCFRLREFVPALDAISGISAGGRGYGFQGRVDNLTVTGTRVNSPRW